jgi:signal transduction histidine kinase
MSGKLEIESQREAASVDRTRRLIETGIALSSELSLDSLLRRLAETAVELTGARYGALGVIDRLGTGLEQFITVGVDEHTKATIGDLPRGRGILGVPIRDHQALRLTELTADPRSAGFPPGHPPMSSFLGVPIMLRGSAYGNLYLTEKAGGNFTEEDEEIVRLLASQAAAAIENARLYESARQWSRQLELLNEVSEALTTETDLSQLLDLAAARLRELLDARVVLIELPTPDGLALRVESAVGENAGSLLGLRLNRASSKAGKTLERQRPERIDSLIDDPEVDQTAPRLLEATTALYVPMMVTNRTLGVIAAYDKKADDHCFSDADLRVATAFANRAAVAIELSERVGREAVRALVEGQEIERKRVARELHDETGQALMSILLGLKGLEEQVGAEPLARIRDLVSSALEDVRRLAAELRPSVLDDFGLEPALERLVATVSERAGIEIHLNVASSDTLPPEYTVALYRIVQESLTNIVKHAEARTVSVVISASTDSVRAVIEDNGKGFDQTTVRDGALGLVGMRERVLLLDGRFEITSSPGHGTDVVVELPLRPRA